MRQLTGPETAVVRKAIKKTFAIHELDMLLTERLDKSMSEFGNPLNFSIGVDTIISNIVKAANRQNWHRDLLLAVMAERPENPALTDVYRLANELGLLGDVKHFHAGEEVDAGRKNGLEKLITSVPSLNIDELIFRLGKVKRRVCRIQLQPKNSKSEWGTGFLVGPDLLLSNYHVFEKLIEPTGEIDKIICLFDYTYNPILSKVNPGTPFPLDVDHLRKVLENGEIKYSKNAQMDKDGGELEAGWPADQLDYALIKLDQQIGTMPFGISSKKAANSEQVRGWINVPAEAKAFDEKLHLIMVQHPDKDHMQVAFGFEGFIGMDKNGTRIRYNVNSQPGSSGSPVLNEQFDLVALHNMGDPSWVSTYNQGVAMWKISEDLKKQGVTFDDFTE